MALDRSTTHRHRIDYVDVFGAGPLTGNPVAVVHGAGDLDDDTMAALARWTNLSETTFLLPPTNPGRLPGAHLTPDRELPFAGHPTLGSAHAWLRPAAPRARPTASSSNAASAGRLRQERERLAFAAPPLIRSGPVDADELAPLLVALDLDPDDVTAQWIDNGPGWMGLLLREPAALLALAPRSLVGFPSVGVAATYPAGHPVRRGGPRLHRRHRHRPRRPGNRQPARRPRPVARSCGPPTAAVRRSPGQLPRAARTSRRPTPRDRPLDRRHDDHHGQRRTRHLIWSAVLSSEQGLSGLDGAHRGCSGRCGPAGPEGMEACRLDARSD